MSLRNVKKVQEAKSTQGEYYGSDDDFEPLCVQKSSKSTYEGLLLSNSSEDENKDKEAAVTDTDNENNLTTEEVEKLNLLEEGKGTKNSKPECTQLEKKKKKKKQKSTKKHVSGDNVDEIDKALSEVNAVLGEPSKPSDYINFKVQDVKARLFTVSRRHLNSSNELSRLFGPDSDNEPRKKHGRRPNLKRIHRCKIIHKEFNFTKLGLSMTIEQREKGLTYFVFEHTREYQKKHQEFMSVIALRNTNLLAPIETSLKGMHVEGLIEASDVMFRMEDNIAASDIIEQAIAYMQFVAHPSFNILDLNTRLEYKYFENRAFHILILKYIHLLSNGACHRTALELAKLLLNLDPSDPLAVVFIIDTLAIRAREHYWLVETTEYLDKDREVGYLFNIKFSKALASFHVSKEAHGDMVPCGKMLQDALLAYPWALREILDAINHRDDALRAHELFNEFALKSTSKYLKDLIHLYAALTDSQWREPPVLEWLKENAKLIAETYDEDRLIRERAVSLEGMRQSLFRGWPEQIQRHLTIIKPMSNLLVDGAVPEVTSTRGYDPMPPRDGINRYGYTLLPRAQTSHGNAILADFFASLMPNYDVLQDGEDPQTSAVHAYRVPSYDSNNFSDDTNTETPSENESDDENNDQNNDHNKDENIDFPEENWDDVQCTSYLDFLKERRAERERRRQELVKQEELGETYMKVASKIQPSELADCFNNKGNEACGSQIENKNEIKIYVDDVDAIEEDVNEVYEAQTGQNSPEIIYEEEADEPTPDEEEPNEPTPNKSKPDDTNSEEAKSYDKTCVTSPNEGKPRKTNSNKDEECEFSPDEGESHEADPDDCITFEITFDEEQPSEAKPNLSQAQ